MNSKRKGNKGERDLSKWWQQWTGMEFNRVPASGGLRWKNTIDTSGDIICTQRPHDRRFQFSIESKNYKDINFEHLILPNKNVDIVDFWTQASTDGERSNKVPIVFMRYNGMPKNMYFVILSHALLNVLIELGISLDHTIFKVHAKDYAFVIMNSSDLLSVNYIELHKELKSLRKNGAKF